ncbi:Enoyl-CoA hydratase [valine degradation] [Pseudonocardia sp. Ae168_Ps1]|uniref:enoyl-CoA hydratase-related protein n=1 Tax=unclassified Pseudonocardia TaxID=2619320 RepID=UPI0001FFE997|nr:MULTISPECIES: enoyl-CoA hydratase-related protein [unclassified Pseudonocardia]ALE72888.1 enoyl-CoA hydratase [Pseudonocardia sp. EC080625-04]ALL76215.1 enoyl-CoA hydratase [Pseudonocardia sp. EC080610-09]ALL83240.1 enoyl-CoA hydratase [Pseudonocardia sp. EC080619-01]OLL73037.1 Enoyl-CoA hydratase [valine degradation] [Pseudonocardia sp. Ae150A_Ps1]OLL79012.1 Enoyl-CoA hydratase [valine degradation] [Pseudonocardia sp. Ae168_Ps1]
MSTVASEFTEIAYDVEDRVATITLDRPDRLNAFTATMARELIAAYDLADADDGVRAIVLTGRGRGFCAGADLGRGGASFDANDPQRAADRARVGRIGDVPRDGGGTVTMRMASLRTPVIAAVNGPAVGIGATMTLPADIRLAASSARFGFVFARRGLVPEAASSWFLPRIVGISQAMEWAATGRVFDAAEAHAGGLVSRVVDDGELLATARAIATEIAENTSAVSVALTRQLLWGMLGAPSPWDAHRADSAAIHHLGQGRDAAEGVVSFLEKRPPEFPATVTEDYPDHVVEPWPGRPGDLTD